VERGGTIADLKLAIRRECNIAPSGTLQLHNHKFDPLNQDQLLLSTVGIVHRSSVFATLQGTPFHSSSSSRLFDQPLALQWMPLRLISYTKSTAMKEPRCTAQASKGTPRKFESF